MRAKLILIFIGLLLCCLCVGCVAGDTETLTVVYCTDQSTYPLSSTITVSGTTYTGITVKDTSNNYWRYYPSLESSSPESAKVALSGTPSSKTWDTVYTVTYIESPGNAYINTQLTPASSKLSGNLRFQIPTVTNDWAFFGSRGGYTSGANGLFLGLVDSGANIVFRTISAQKTWVSSNVIVDNTVIYDCDFIYSPTSDFSVSINNQVITSSSSASQISITTPIYIGKCNNVQNTGNVRIYGSKLSLNSEQIRDYIPIHYGTTYALYDNCLSDTVIYTNAGSGSFTGGGTESPLTYSHYVSNPPTIESISSPTSPSAINTAVSSTVTASPSVTGNTLTYQWEVNPNGGATWTVITGQTDARLTYTPSTVGQHQFRCTVTETETGLSTAATTHVFLVVTAPTLGTTTISATSGKLNQAYTPTITVPISNMGGASAAYYKLQSSTDSGTTWADTGITSYSIGNPLVVNPTINDATATTHSYRILVTTLQDTYSGVTLATSSTVTFTTYAAPTVSVITVSPNQATIGSTSPVSLSVTTGTPATGDTYSYAWKYKLSTASSYTALATTTTNTYSWSVSSLSIGTYDVTVDVTGIGGTVQATAATLEITSYTATLTWDTSSHTYADSFTLSVSGTSASDTVQWYYQQTAPTAGTHTAIPGASTVSYHTSPQALGLTAGNTYMFDVVITRSGTPITIDVAGTITPYANPIPNTPGAPTAPVAVPYTITLTASCSNEDQVASYKWQLQNGATWQQVATGQQYEPTLSTPGDYVYRFIAVGKNGNEIPSSSVTVRAGYKPSSVITSPETGTQVTAGSRIDISATIGGTSGTYTFNFGEGVADHGTTSGSVNEQTKTITTYVKYTVKNGLKPITLTVSNDFGTTATYTIQIENGKSTLRPLASATVKPVDASGIYNFINNTQPVNSSNPLPNMSAMVKDLTSPITSVIGEWFYLLIFAVPYLIIFLRQKNILIPSILGVLFAAWLLVMLPGSAMKAAIGILVLCVAGGIFGLYVKRHS